MWAASGRKRLFDSILLKKQRKSSRCVLLSSITMKYKIFRLAAFLISISKCGSNQVSTGVTRYSVTNDPAGVEIQNDAEIYPIVNNLTQQLSLQIGDNYMKRSRYYISACIIGLLASLLGLILANSDVSFKDLVSFNFTFDIQRIKEIATYIFSTMLVFSASLLVFSIGFRKKQLEDISQIKKYALYELLSSVKRQESQLIEYPPIEDPSILYVSYVLNAFEVKKSCNKVLAAYSNLLTTQERDAVKQLQLYANSFFSDLGIHADDIKQYNVVSFSEFYNEKVRTAPQNEKINNFTYTLQRDLNKYSEQIKLFCNEFKQCY